MMFLGIDAVVYAQAKLASLLLEAVLRPYLNECSHRPFKFHFSNKDLGDFYLTDMLSKPSSQHTA